ILGPILFLVLFNLPHMVVRYFGGIYGYKFGTGIMQQANSSGIMEKISKGATIVGLMVIGAMSASMVKLNTALTFNVGEEEIPMQDYLDQIFPLLLPLLYTILMFALLKKGYKPTTILLITI